MTTAVIATEICDRCEEEVGAREVFIDEYGAICDECYGAMESAVEFERNGVI